MIRIIYEIYKWLIAFPLIFITTILITLSTGIGSRLFGSKFWGYYPPHFWGKLWCWLFFVKVKVNKEAEIDRTMIAQSEKCIVAADFSKFDRAAFAKISDPYVADYIVTNKGVNSEILTQFNGTDTNIIFA